MEFWRSPLAVGFGHRIRGHYRNHHSDLGDLYASIELISDQTAIAIVNSLQFGNADCDWMWGQ